MVCRPSLLFIESLLGVVYITLSMWVGYVYSGIYNFICGMCVYMAFSEADAINLRLYKPVVLQLYY